MHVDPYGDVELGSAECFLMLFGFSGLVHIHSNMHFTWPFALPLPRQVSGKTAAGLV